VQGRDRVGQHRDGVGVAGGECVTLDGERSGGDGLQADGRGRAAQLAGVRGDLRKRRRRIARSMASRCVPVSSANGV
jgi:hypothetical protein